MPPVVGGDHNKELEYNRKEQETFPTQAMILGPMMTRSTKYSDNHDVEVFEDTAVPGVCVAEQEILSQKCYSTGFRIAREHGIHEPVDWIEQWIGDVHIVARPPHSGRNKEFPTTGPPLLI